MGTSTHADDGELLRRIAGGDRAAFGELYAIHAPWVLLRIRRRAATADQASEILQDTFLAIWRNASTFRGTDAGGWIWTIAVRRVVDASRRAAVRPRSWAALPELPSPSAEDIALAAVLAPDLEHALAALSPELRAVLQATVLDGLSTRDAAALLDVPEGTVKSRAARARSLLRTQLAASQPLLEDS